MFQSPLLEGHAAPRRSASRACASASAERPVGAPSTLTATSSRRRPTSAPPAWWPRSRCCSLWLGAAARDRRRPAPPPPRAAARLRRRARRPGRARARRDRLGLLLRGRLGLVRPGADRHGARGRGLRSRPRTADAARGRRAADARRRAPRGRARGLRGAGGDAAPTAAPVPTAVPVSVPVRAVHGGAGASPASTRAARTRGPAAHRRVPAAAGHSSLSGSAGRCWRSGRSSPPCSRRTRSGSRCARTSRATTRSTSPPTAATPLRWRPPTRRTTIDPLTPRPLLVRSAIEDAAATPRRPSRPS